MEILPGIRKQEEVEWIHFIKEQLLGTIFLKGWLYDVVPSEMAALIGADL